MFQTQRFVERDGVTVDGLNYSLFRAHFLVAIGTHVSHFLGGGHDYLIANAPVGDILIHDNLCVARLAGRTQFNPWSLKRGAVQFHAG